MYTHFGYNISRASIIRIRPSLRSLPRQPLKICARGRSRYHPFQKPCPPSPDVFFMLWPRNVVFPCRGKYPKRASVAEKSLSLRVGLGGLRLRLHLGPSLTIAAGVYVYMWVYTNTYTCRTFPIPTLEKYAHTLAFSIPQSCHAIPSRQCVIATHPTLTLVVGVWKPSLQ